ncbi:LLM class F420-dependent oxidoreductase [Actinoplanes cyaneus]|uniref:LLM class F420-dependent oxidoreductase n=1 Tax=Actinoplanes cyaneus TaxID=52696 RepID=A0A919IQH2_9ACTN|nr:LLM class flavin-dependent oxidoreductase [Actinoplanes cyaneus]MCW2139739.1 putative F420-dependent oxidoreductase, Rv3520c family [Actinoplanes cyaneus]GID69894.1 LLM class F420-dependent oxidoreductase [Actinoplanes cyaneus]
MKLGVNLVYQGAGELAREAERLGYAIALAPEGYKSDAPSVLGYVAGQTERIALASGVMQIPGRTPAMAALTAATLDSLSGGRFRLGLGVSNPDVANGWYGAASDHPLGRTREYVGIVRAALRGGPVSHDGTYYPLPATGSSPAPLHLFTEPLRADLPIYLAAVGPRNLRLAGEIADGWIGVFASPAAVKSAVDEIRAGRARAGRELDGFDVLPCLATSVAGDPRPAADALRAHFVYLLGIGDRERNFYCAMADRLGFTEAVTELRDRLAGGDRAGAAAAVPFDFIDATSLIGPVDRIAGRMREYADAGVTTLGIMVSAAATDLDGRLAIVRQAAEALERSGTAG